MTWGVSRLIQTTVGSPADRESNAPVVHEVAVTKVLDVATPRLLQQALYGKGVVAKIHLCKTDNGELKTYAEYVLTNTLISGFNTSTGGDRPSESLNLNFTKVQFNNVSESASADDSDDQHESIMYDTAKVKGK
jgi:type VI secretion system secreted protein Hcp